MDEPVGTVSESAPWPDARGPHLPDALTRFMRVFPFGGWLFLLASIGDLAWNARDLLTRSLAFTPAEMARDVIGWLPSVAICLFGAALFARHRHAWSTHRLLVIGLALLVLVEAMQIGSVVFVNQIDTFGRSVDDLSTIGPGTLSVSITIALLRIVGLVLVARGIFAVRQFEEDLNADRRMTIITLLSIPLVIISVASVVLYTSTLDLTQLKVTDIAYLILGALVSAMAVAALAYITTIVTAGWRSHERPRMGWRFAALAVWLIFLALYIGTTVQVVVLVVAASSSGQAAQPTWATDVFSASSAIRALGYVALLLAFMLGFPSPHAAADDDDDFDFDYDEADEPTR